MARIIDRNEEMRDFMTRFADPRNQFLNDIRSDENAPARNILSEYCTMKRSEGCSIHTLKSYFSVLREFLFCFNEKPLNKIDATDIRAFLMHYQEERGISNSTADSMRRCLCSFYNFLMIEDYVEKDPMLKIHKIKADSVIKMPFTEEELERIRDSCHNIRELALIDFLYSTGVRVSECANADIMDISLKSQEGIVYGKGGKERVVYLDTRAKIHLERYLNRRYDHDPALFVRSTPPCERISRAGIEYMCHMIGMRAGVENCHPHRFRRTLATNLLERGMPIEQVQTILGHAKLDTTLIYAKVNHVNVKLNHQKYI